MDDNRKKDEQSVAVLLFIPTAFTATAVFSILAAVFISLIRSESTATTLNRAGSLIQFISAFMIIPLFEKFVIAQKTLFNSQVERIASGSRSTAFKWRVAELIFFASTICLFIYNTTQFINTELLIFFYIPFGLILLIGIIAVILTPIALPYLAFVVFDLFERRGVRIFATFAILLVAFGALLQYFATYFA